MALLAVVFGLTLQVTRATAANQNLNLTLPITFDTAKASKANGYGMEIAPLEYSSRISPTRVILPRPSFGPGYESYLAQSVITPTLPPPEPVTVYEPTQLEPRLQGHPGFVIGPVVASTLFSPIKTNVSITVDEEVLKASGELKPDGLKLAFGLAAGFRISPLLQMRIYWLRSNLGSARWSSNLLRFTAAVPQTIVRYENVFDAIRALTVDAPDPAVVPPGMVPPAPTTTNTLFVRISEPDIVIDQYLLEFSAKIPSGNPDFSPYLSFAAGLSELQLSLDAFKSKSSTLTFGFGAGVSFQPNPSFLLEIGYALRSHGGFQNTIKFNETVHLQIDPKVTSHALLISIHAAF